MSETTQPDFRALFAEQVANADDTIDLQRAALCLAGEEYPSLDVEEYLGRMDKMAAEAKSLAGRSPQTEDVARTLTHYLFDREGFSGNAEDYYNPENSFLNRVLDTRTGIPITLSVLFLGLAKRLGLACHGVGMPGHFLVSVRELDLYMDPFHSGQLLSASDCRRLAQSMFGPAIEWNEGFLAATSSKLILFRMLNNLRQIYLHNNEPERRVSVLERMLLIDDSSLPLYRELAFCQLDLGQRDSAIKTLEKLIQLSENDRDNAAARDLISKLLQARQADP